MRCALLALLLVSCTGRTALRLPGGEGDPPPDGGDASGHGSGEQSAPPTVTIDTPPAGSYVNGANVATFVLGGACSANGQAVELSGAGVGQGACTAGRWQALLDLGSAVEGTVSVRADHRDAAGTAAPPATRDFVKDTLPPAISVTTPNGGETWIVGQGGEISWTASDTGSGLAPAPITLAFSGDDGGAWAQLAEGEANDGSFSWLVPDTPTTLARVRVSATDQAGNAGADASDAPFAIAPPGAPSAPRSLAATAAAGEVRLTWLAPLSGTAPFTYTVRRSLTSGAGYVDLDTGRPTTAYVDNTVQNGTTYYYVVAATNLAGTGGNSNEVAATPDYQPTLVFDLGGGTLEPTVGAESLSFTRAESGLVATYWGPDGILRFAPHNLALQSEALDAASWTLLHATIVADAALAPDGTMTADKLAETTGVDGKNAYVEVIKGPGPQHFTCSVYVKPAGRDWAGLSLGRGIFSIISYFDVAIGQAGSQHDNDTEVELLRREITPAGNGWYRAELTGLVNSGAAVVCAVWSQDVDPMTGFPTVDGDPTRGLYVWGMQLESNFSASIYMPTTTAASYGGPRFEHDPSTAVAQGLLLEASRTNLLLHSTDLSDPVWTITSGSASVAAPNIAPDGTDTPFYVEPSPVTANVRLRQTISKPAASQTYTCSVYARYAGACFVALSLDSGTGRSIVYHYICCCEGAASAGLSCPPGNTYVDNTNTFVGDLFGFRGYGGYTWRRLSITGTTDASTSVSCSIWTDGDESNACTPTPGAGSSGTNHVFLWGPQLEQGDHPTSYIPTAAAPVTRAADGLSIASTAGWFAPLASTYWLEADTTNQAATIRLVGGADLPEVRVSPAAVVAALAPSTVLATEAYAATDRLRFRVAAAFASGDSAVSVNGQPAAAGGTTFTVGGSGPVLFGANGDARLDGHLRRVRYYPDRVADADLARLTADLGFADDFDDGQIGPRWREAVWTVKCAWCYTNGTEVAVDETGGRLVISFADRDGANGLVTLDTYDFTGAVMTAELVTPPLASADIEVGIAVTFPGGEETVSLFAYQGNLLGQTNTLALGWQTVFTQPFSAVNHRFLSLGHEPGSDRFVFRTSADGVNWTTRATEPVFGPIVDSALLIYGNSYNVAAGSTPDAVFDNFATNAARN